jgi:peptidoglycan/xylan/chitin deacetylase (PgdA/CDA1 family)
MQVALTVDVEDPDQRVHAGPGALTTILDALATAGIRATFFVQGRWLAANPEPAAGIIGAGHLVGNHSYYHADTTLLTSRGVRDDVAKGHKEIEDALGIDARPWYRLPYGAGAESPRIKRQLHALGYRHVGWDVDVNDYALTDSDALVPAVEAAISERERAGASHAIVLLHSWPVVTAEAMPALCRFLLERCDGTVTVDDVPGNGTVETTSPLVGRARGLASRTQAVLTHRS